MLVLTVCVYIWYFALQYRARETGRLLPLRPRPREGLLARWLEGLLERLREGLLERLRDGLLERLRGGLLGGLLERLEDLFLRLLR